LGVTELGLGQQELRISRTVFANPNKEKKADKYQKEKKIREKSEPIVPGNLYTSKTLWRKQTRLKSFRSKPVGWGLECFDFKSQESPKPFQRCERDFTKSVSSYFEFSTSSSFE
jgi:hypothetical protein